MLLISELLSRPEGWFRCQNPCQIRQIIYYFWSKNFVCMFGCTHKDSVKSYPKDPWCLVLILNCEIILWADEMNI